MGMNGGMQFSSAVCPSLAGEARDSTLRSLLQRYITICCNPISLLRVRNVPGLVLLFFVNLEVMRGWPLILWLEKLGTSSWV